MARLKLIPIQEQPLLLWGLVSPYPSHKLCWMMNQLMDWSLSRGEDIVVSNGAENMSDSEIWSNTSYAEESFARFTYVDEGWLYTVEVIANKSGSEPLFAELRNFDYLMVVHGETAHFPKNVKDVLQKPEGIHSVLTLNPQRIRELPRLQAYIG